MITVDQLDKLVLRAKAEEFAQSINDTLVKFDINTPPRIRHFLAQVLHESGNLVYVQEIANGSAYEGRKDLGNVYPGDGVRFKGRGFIQCTGRANYAAISKDLGFDFIASPEALATPKFAALSAGWFWNKHDLNRYADMPDDAKLNLGRYIGISPLEYITRRINGGVNGIADRQKNYNLLKSIV